jgi:hypothetical protein
MRCDPIVFALKYEVLVERTATHGTLADKGQAHWSHNKKAGRGK